LHYKTNTGLLRPGDPADFILVKDLEKFEVLRTYIDGTLVAENGHSLINPKKTTGETKVNHFDCLPVQPADFVIDWKQQASITVIEALDGQLITNKKKVAPKVEQGKMVSDTANDVLKIGVVNRYHAAPIATGFIKNVGFTAGAIASSVAHDSHNIVAVGADDESLSRAVNLVIAQQGGISCVSADAEMVIALPVAGLMSDQNGYDVATAYTAIDAMAKSLGSGLSAPFMTLSFMALLVIPHVKLSDKGLFDADAFEFLA
jgi:adenine deaminase